MRFLQRAHLGLNLHREETKPSKRMATAQGTDRMTGCSSQVKARSISTRKGMRFLQRAHLGLNFDDSVEMLRALT
jgi:hypothetical protein